MRYHLLKTFDTIYILDLHGNARKKEAAPDGSKDENVFDIMQGVSINIFVKNKNSSLTQSLNDCGGSARSFMPHKPPSPHLAKHSNLTQDTRISCYKSLNPHSQHSEDSNEKPQKLAQIYHYDLYGKRSDKTNFLYANTLDSIAWATLQPKAPFYLFIPQNESLRAEYDKGFSVKDIFKVSSVGVVTGKDSVLIASNEKQLEQQVKDFYNEFDLKFVKNIAYRPFDLMKVYYDTSKVTRPRFEVMQHFLQDFENCAISIPRQLKDDGKAWNHCMVTNYITDQALTSGGNGAGVIHPLYLKNTESSKDKKSKKDSQANADSKQGQWIENFTSEFREFIDSKYNEHFSPEQILGYIYAVLFHKDYREKYIDFLKIDFPKIPFVESKEKFLTLSALGQELISTHLMQDSQQERERERERERTEMMRMTCNIGLNVARQYKMSGSWQCVIVTNTLVDLSLMGGGNTGAGTIFPLYLYQKA